MQSLELLELFDIIPEALPYIRNAKDCTSLMMFLVNDILDFAQLEEKKIVINLNQAVNLAKIVQECTQILLFKATMKMIRLTSNFQESFPSVVYLDGNRLKQILINLVSNAVKYTLRGQVTVDVRIELQQIKILVKDSGVGIERRKLQNLFTPFNKIMRNRELNTEGVGLGLIVSKSLA